MDNVIKLKLFKGENEVVTTLANPTIDCNTNNSNQSLTISNYNQTTLELSSLDFLNCTKLELILNDVTILTLESSETRTLHISYNFSLSKTSLSENLSVSLSQNM